MNEQMFFSVISVSYQLTEVHNKYIAPTSGSEVQVQYDYIGCKYMFISRKNKCGGSGKNYVHSRVTLVVL